MNQRDWKPTLSVWIVCGVVGLMVLTIVATMLGVFG
jgi:hypothetical protein